MKWRGTGATALRFRPIYLRRPPGTSLSSRPVDAAKRGASSTRTRYGRCLSAADGMSGCRAWPGAFAASVAVPVRSCPGQRIASQRWTCLCRASSNGSGHLVACGVEQEPHNRVRPREGCDRTQEHALNSVGIIWRAERNRIGPNWWQRIGRRLSARLRMALGRVGYFFAEFVYDQLLQFARPICGASLNLY